MELSIRVGHVRRPGVDILPVRRGARVTIGRSSACTIRLEDDDISRQQALLSVGAKGTIATNLSSSKTIEVDGISLGPGQSVQVGWGVKVDDHFIAVADEALDGVVSLALDASGQRFLAGWESGRVELRQVADRALLATYELPSKATSVAFDAEENIVLATHDLGACCRWSIAAGRAIPPIVLDHTSLSTVEVSGDGRHLLLCGTDLRRRHGQEATMMLVRPRYRGRPSMWSGEVGRSGACPFGALLCLVDANGASVVRAQDFDVVHRAGFSEDGRWVWVEGATLDHRGQLGLQAEERRGLIDVEAGQVLSWGLGATPTWLREVLPMTLASGGTFTTRGVLASTMAAAGERLVAVARARDGGVCLELGADGCVTAWTQQRRHTLWRWRPRGAT